VGGLTEDSKHNRAVRVILRWQGSGRLSVWAGMREGSDGMMHLRGPFFVLSILLIASLACGESESVSTTPAPVVEQPTLRATYTPIPTEGAAASEASQPPTDTPEPASTVPPTDTPPPTGTPPPPAVIRGVTDYKSEYGTLHVVGEVVNQSELNFNFVKVVASFYDAGDRLVATEFTFSDLDILEAGGIVPFNISVLDPSPDIATYKLDVEWNTTNQTPLRVDILSHSASVTAYGSYNIMGEVQNPYDFPLEFVKVVATCYNAANEVLRVDFTFTELHTLDPGQRSPFELTVMDPPEELDHYSLQTEANRK
jgi:hypothetical protein